jgi:exopolysaccharide biosynthesis polyprenyl glycosylphosphotransferase
MSGVRVIDDSQFLEQQQARISLDGIKAGDFIFADGYTGAVLLRGSKRLLDVSIALLMLCVGLPIMAMVALAILLESGLPVIYVQERVGLHGKPFQLYKFRSMRQNAEVDGQPVWATQADQRVTRLGRFLRQTRLDELPQLFNVLLGDMSLVGPRPERPAFVSALAQEIPFYALRHQVKPGITGWAQICFPYGASSEDARQKLQYDLYYLKNYSLFLDLNILCLTLQVVLWGKGAR